MQLIPHIILMLEGFSMYLDETCDADCDEFNPYSEWKTAEFKCNEEKAGCFPSLEQLQRLCPDTLSYLNCKSKAMETCEELLADPSNLDLCRLVKFSMKVENLLRDLCNESSSFHKDYTSRINCYKGLYFRLTDICWKMMNETKQEFLEYMDLTDTTIPAAVKCLLIKYQDACLADKFDVFCGKSAQNIFVETQRTFQGVFSLDCSQVGEEWESKFFSFLEKMWKISFKDTFGIV